MTPICDGLGKRNTFQWNLVWICISRDRDHRKWFIIVIPKIFERIDPPGLKLFLYTNILFPHTEVVHVVVSRRTRPRAYRVCFCELEYSDPSTRRLIKMTKWQVYRPRLINNHCIRSTVCTMTVFSCRCVNTAYLTGVKCLMLHYIIGQIGVLLAQQGDYGWPSGGLDQDRNLCRLYYPYRDSQSQGTCFMNRLYPVFNINQDKIIIEESANCI